MDSIEQLIAGRQRDKKSLQSSPSPDPKPKKESQPSNPEEVN